jgi:Na+/melibiose symporter-like transporter
MQVFSWEQAMSLGTILLIVLVLILVGVIPSWPHSRGWGYRPTGMVGAILIVLLILILAGRI